VISAGPVSDRPNSGQLVMLKCCGRLEDGTEIDRYDCLKLVLGDYDFIDGEPATLMKILPKFSLAYFLFSFI